MPLICCSIELASISLLWLGGVGREGMREGGSKEGRSGRGKEEQRKRREGQA